MSLEVRSVMPAHFPQGLEYCHSSHGGPALLLRLTFTLDRDTCVAALLSKATPAATRQELLRHVAAAVRNNGAAVTDRLRSGAWGEAEIARAGAAVDELFPELRPASDGAGE